MRRVLVADYGPPSVLTVAGGTVPEPGEDEVLVRVEAAGVNFVDLLQRSGVYTVRHPWAPGFEGAGVVLRVGAGVTGVAEGDRVAWAGGTGSYATHCIVPRARLVPVPEGLSCADAAAVLIHGMTAHCLVSDVAPVREGDVCLVHAAGGGVGGLLCQLAVQRGAVVIGTASSEAKARAAAEAGAAHVIDYTREDFSARVKEITGGTGVDVVYDAVGKDTFEGGLASLRPRGVFVLYGQSGGALRSLDPQALNGAGSVFFTKPSLGHYDRTHESLVRRAEQVFGAVASGRLRVRVHASYPLDRAPEAHEAVESRRAVGKVLISP